MDFINLVCVATASLFPLCVTETEGYKYEDLGSYEMVQKQEEFVKKRFFGTSTIAGWNLWSPWSVCSSSCREGIQARGRACNTGVTSDCAGQNYDVKACNLGPCSVWNPWSPWSVCSRTCGDGLKARGRSCESGVLSDCDGPYYENDNCTLKSCSAWIPWSSWSSCSHSCGGGFQTRDRTCNTNVNSDCEGHSYDIQECNAVPCDGISSTSNPTLPSGHTGVDGKWSDWGTYSSCSVTCGNGTHTRYRSCLFNDPAASHRVACFGANSTTEPCNPGPCPVDGTWSAWTNYTTCSKTCGGGVQFRSRQCVFLNGHPHGRDCIGNNTSSQECHTDMCPILCFECREDSAVCEHKYQPIQCAAPTNYCINHLTNKQDGTRIVVRRCGTEDECVNDWWQTYSDNELCKNFNQESHYNIGFDCKYCCVKDNCNERINPPKETNFFKN